MLTKTIHVNTPFTFRSILKGINQTVEDDFIKRLRVDNDFINYTIINAKGDEYAEITFTLEEDYNCVVPTVKDIIISTSEPPVNNVGWLKPLSNGTFMLFFFGDKGWTPISIESSGELKFQYIQEVPDIIIEIQ